MSEFNDDNGMTCTGAPFVDNNGSVHNRDIATPFIDGVEDATDHTSPVASVVGDGRYIAII